MHRWLLCLFNILSCNLLPSPWIVPLLSPENVVKCGQLQKTWSNVVKSFFQVSPSAITKIRTAIVKRFAKFHAESHPILALCLPAGRNSDSAGRVGVEWFLYPYSILLKPPPLQLKRWRCSRSRLKNQLATRTRRTDIPQKP